MSADSMSLAIALSSPSGRMSKRARKAALARLAAMHAAEAAAAPPVVKREPTAQQRAALLLQRAADYRGMAARGMHPRLFPRMAAKLEAEAAALLAGAS